jgi:hypothetical protein
MVGPVAEQGHPFSPAPLQCVENLRGGLTSPIALMPGSKHPDWSRRLPRPIIIPRVMTLRTLADVRELLRHLSKEHKAKETWQHFAAQLDEAAHGADPVNVATALQMVFGMERVEYRLK